MTSENILAIESGVAGGSLALMAGTAVLESWSSKEKASRSEHLLPRIAEMLETAGMKPSDLSKIAVSNGPGSYTGIRIGLATAMGLSAALGTPCVGVSLLKALASESESREKIVVVPIGRDGFCWQHFDDAGDDGKAATPGSGKLEEFKAVLEKHRTVVVLAQSDAFRDLAEARIGPGVGEIIDIGRDLAVAVGRYSVRGDDGLQPFYASDIPITPAAGARN